MILALVEAERNTSIAMEETSYNQAFSKIYDKALDILPYDEMANFLEKVFKLKNIQPKSLLDLGCGTASLAIIMAKLNYKVSGLDLSSDMLSIAEQKLSDKELDVKLINQSMSEMQLIYKYDIIYSFGDALNYLTDEGDLLSTFKKVYKYLSNDSYFIFDVNTEEKFLNYGNNSFSESDEDFFYLWENEYDEENKLNYYYVEVFTKKENKNLYERDFETHCERAYTDEELRDLLEKANFKDIETYSDLNFTEARTSKDRLYYICKKSM